MNMDRNLDFLDGFRIRIVDAQLHSLFKVYFASPRSHPFYKLLSFYSRILIGRVNTQDIVDITQCTKIDPLSRISKCSKRLKDFIHRNDEQRVNSTGPTRIFLGFWRRSFMRSKSKAAFKSKAVTINGRPQAFDSSIIWELS
eukprot:Filipodium_phascolosomae@DN2585_c0_g1_i1.p1